MSGAQLLLSIYAYLQSIGGNGEHKLIVDKNTFTKLVEQFHGMIQDEAGNFLNPLKLENVKYGKVFKTIIEVE